MHCARPCRLRKAKSVVLAPNIQDVSLEGGLNDELDSLLALAAEAGVPAVFALNRRKLGAIYGARKAMSAIAILDYSGANEAHAEMLRLAEEGRQHWRPPPREDAAAP